MVTTRRGTETPGQDSSATPRSSAKRKVGKRELEALDTPTAVKRQKKTTPKKKAAETVEEPAVEDAPAPESAEDTSDTIDVAIPRSQTPTQVGKLAIRRRSSPQVVVAKLSREGSEEALDEDALTPTQETSYQTPDQHSGSAYATPATQKKGEASPTPRAKRANERTSSTKKSSGRKTKAQDATPTASSKQSPVASQDAAETPSQPKKAHMRFGSEEPAEKVSINLQGHKRYDAPNAQIADSEDDDSASDSDEAPEVVTTTAAASRIAATQHDAARAHLALQEKEAAKRSARESRIAAEQAEKRKREDLKAKKAARKLAKQTSTTEEPAESASAKANIDLAGLLPTSLLSSLPDRRAPTPPPARYGKTEEQLRQEKLNHHIKFLERTDKGIKEVKRGKLSVAVLGKQNRGVLPPKVNRDSRDVREKWLKGREGKRVKGGKGIGGKVERKRFGGGGFLRGED